MLHTSDNTTCFPYIMIANWRHIAGVIYILLVEILGLHRYCLPKIYISVSWDGIHIAPPNISWCHGTAHVLPAQYMFVPWDSTYIVPSIYIGAVGAVTYCPISRYWGPIGENMLTGQYMLGPRGCQYIDRSIYILGLWGRRYTTYVEGLHWPIASDKVC